jgi:hypothetical protein
VPVALDECPQEPSPLIKTLGQAPVPKYIDPWMPRTTDAPYRRPSARPRLGQDGPRDRAQQDDDGICRQDAGPKGGSDKP